MKKLLSPVAAVAFLALFAGTASANEESRSSVRLFGQTICFADAPAIMDCDIRLSFALPRSPARAENAEGPSSFRLLGKTYCPVPRADCDYNLEVAGGVETVARSLEVFGLQFCLGDGGPGCDFAIPAHQSGQQRASL